MGMLEQINERIKKEQEAFGPLDEKTTELDCDFVLKCMRHNELGDGTIYSILNKNKFVINTHTRQVFKWGGHSWTPDIYSEHLTAVEPVAQEYAKIGISLFEEISETSSDKDSAIKQLEKLQSNVFKRASRLRSKRGRENCFSLATTLERNQTIAVSGEVFDTNPWLLGCNNGVLDLKTGKFRDGKQEDFISKASPVDYKGMKAKCKKWLKFLNEVFDNDTEIIDFLQRLLGYCITGLNYEHIFPVWTGRGRNGKGTISTIVYYILGQLAAPIKSEMLLAQAHVKNSSAPTADIMALKGLRVAFASETNEKHSFDPAQIKLFTGGDKLTGRNPHDTYQSSFDPSHSLILLTNEKPRCPGDDYAFWQRVLLLEFPFSFIDNPTQKNEKQKVEDMDEQLKEEAPGILAWMIRGCLLWQKNGLSPPDKVKAATLEYQKAEDLVGMFIDEKCIVSEEHKENATLLYESFKDWYRQKVGVRPMSQIRFGKKVGKKFQRYKSGGVTFYNGLKLKNAYQDEEKTPF